MSLAASLLVCLSIVGSAYITHADIDENKKTVANAVVIIVWIVVFVISIIAK